MRLVGYTDRLSVSPGDAIQFMVSCDAPKYQADLVRLIHGDENPDGPGFKEQEVHTSMNGKYSGRVQTIHSGSYITVPNSNTISQIFDGLQSRDWGATHGRIGTTETIRLSLHPDRDAEHAHAFVCALEDSVQEATNIIS